MSGSIVSVIIGVMIGVSCCDTALTRIHMVWGWGEDV